MPYKLFLDDIRDPANCVTYMHTRIGIKNPVYLEHWFVARNYSQFIKIIERNGLPEIVSFDHDLAFDLYFALTGTELILQK